MIHTLLTAGESKENVQAVIDLGWLGNWDNIMVNEYMGVAMRGLDQERLKNEGQYYAVNYWKTFLDLDMPGLWDWYNSLGADKMGLTESPLELKESVEAASQVLGLSINEGLQVDWKPFNIHLLLSDGLPALAIYGNGSELIGTEQDDASTINEDDLFKMTALIYQTILNLMGGNDE